VAKILVVGNAGDPFWGRGLVGTRAGHRVFWYSDARRELPGVERMLHPPRVPRALSGVTRALWLRRTIRRLRPDLVHVFFANQGLASLILARVPRLVVTTMGGDVLDDQPEFASRRRQFLTARVFANARAITCQAAFMERSVARWGPFAHKTERITWGVHRDVFRPGLETADLRERYGLDPDELVFFCVRLCRPLYNKDVVVRAFAQARAKGLRATLLISEQHAFPDYLAQIRGLVDELGLAAHVRFVGWIPHEDMPRFMNLADVVVSVPSSDGLPQSVLECMACGTYPLVGDHPSYDELVVDGVHGRRVPLRDVGALAEAMRWVTTPEAEREAVIERNLTHVAELADWDEQAARMNAIYERVLQE